MVNVPRSRWAVKRAKRVGLVFGLLPVIAMTLPGIASAAPPIDVAIVWHVSSAAIAGVAEQSADAALEAPLIIGSVLRAARAHPGARLTMAIDANDLLGLQQAAAETTILSEAANERLAPSDPRTADLQSLLARRPPCSDRFFRTPGGRRYEALASSVRSALAGKRWPVFSRRDWSDFAGTAALLWLAAAGAPQAYAGLEKANIDARAALAALARADDVVARSLQTEAAKGTVELVATPAGAPVLPLIVDSGGKSSIDPNIVDVRAPADAGRLVDDAIAMVRRLAPDQRGVGLYSPFGAYDDATADVILQHRAAYALFSDRVVLATGVGASADSVAAADAASFHAYALHVSKAGSVLPALFWAQRQSSALSATLPDWAARSLGDGIVAAARGAASVASGARYPSVLVLNIEAQGAWAKRTDYATAVDSIVSTLAGTPAIHAVTPTEFLRANPDADAAYGFPSNSSAGSFALWMGSPAQASLWYALVNARRAAGGDAALDHPATRDPLLRAEGARWFEITQLPQNGPSLARALAQFRELLATIYRGAGKNVPRDLARVKSETPPVLSAPPTPLP